MATEQRFYIEELPVDGDVPPPSPPPSDGDSSSECDEEGDENWEGEKHLQQGAPPRGGGDCEGLTILDAGPPLGEALETLGEGVGRKIQGRWRMEAPKSVGGRACPSPRGGATLTPVGHGKLVLFGGVDMNQESFQGLTVFDTDSRLWSAPTCTGKGPRARGGHVAVPLPVAAGSSPNSKSPSARTSWLLVFGGMQYDSGSGSTFNDMFVLNTHSWVWHEVPALEPPPRNSASAVLLADGSKLLMFGGAAPDGPTNSVHLLQLDGLLTALGQGSNQDGQDSSSSSNDGGVLECESLLRWQTVSCAGDVPSPREMASICHVETSSSGGRSETVLLMGGRDAEGRVLNDLYALHVGNKQWSRLSDAPAPRCAHTALSIRKGTQVLVFGGWDGAATFADNVWIYSVLEDRWMERQEVSPTPVGRFAHAAAVEVAEAEGQKEPKVWIFGGINPMQDVTQQSLISLEGSAS